MKCLMFIFSIVFSFSLLAGYMPISKVDGNIHKGLEIFTNQNTCSSHYAEKCIKIPNGYNHDYHVLVDETKDDLNNPIWGTRSMITSCDGESDCKEKSASLECINGRESFYDAEFTEVWCNKIIGYEQISTGKKLIVEDAAKKSEFEAVKQAAKLKEEFDKNKFEALKEKLKSSDLSVSEINQVLKHILKL